MAKVKIEFNSSGMADLLNQAARDICKPHADSVASRCGVGYASDLVSYSGGRSRSIASVYTADPEAMRDNLKNNTILRNLK